MHPKPAPSVTLQPVKVTHAVTTWDCTQSQTRASGLWCKLTHIKFLVTKCLGQPCRSQPPWTRRELWKEQSASNRARPLCFVCLFVFIVLSHVCLFCFVGWVCLWEWGYVCFFPGHISFLHSVNYDNCLHICLNKCVISHYSTCMFEKLSLTLYRHVCRNNSQQKI